MRVTLRPKITYHATERALSMRRRQQAYLRHLDYLRAILTYRWMRTTLT